MAKIRTVDFLPEIFQTPVNRQFLAATLDQLVQEPKFEKTQGYVGRKVGPGVNPEDNYVLEPTKSRDDYQLEPGVVSLESDSDVIADVITYPGITDALKVQGAYTTDSNRLYTSEYYSWDPFVDFDKFVNFSQYYWLPNGPDAVDVAATQFPLTDNFIVTRDHGVYTIDGYSGNNPPLTLVRGGNYAFEVAQNAKEDINFRVTNNSTSAFVIDYASNPTLTLVRGNTYEFDLSLSGIFPFFIKTEASLGNINTYDSGVSRNGATDGVITFVVPQDAPDTLFYCNNVQFNMRGQFNVIDGTPGTGPGFWIQSDPGVNGRVPTTPNISSRGVLGVNNNGEDLGTVTFDVPLSTAQNFYYGLTTIAPVDLITSLKFNEINNVFVDTFIEIYGGIDGITNLNGRTVIFLNQVADAEAGGWQQTTQFDPLPSLAAPGTLGTFDTTTFDQTTDLTITQRYSVWQIQYVATDDGSQYIKLNSVTNIANLEKFTILFGTSYSNTGWYKNAEGYFQQIPLLTAIKDLLFYQDGVDPGIFGQIRIIDQVEDTTLDIDDIIGAQTYTAPNGVMFTNGLKVVFRGDVDPVSYQNKEYYIEGVGTGIKLLPVSDFVTPEIYVEDQYILLENSDSTIGGPLVLDYLTINRDSQTINGWSRSNRWFHIDVINATAAYNNTIAVLDNRHRGRRPILEFRGNIKLFGFGTEAKQPIDIIDFEETDAFSNIQGTTGYTIDGYSFVNNTRVIFAADVDPEVRNKIYLVEFIEPDLTPTTPAANIIVGLTYTISILGTTDWNIVAGTTGVVYIVGDSFTAVVVGTGTGVATFSEPIINLVPTVDSLVLFDQTVLCLFGDDLRGLEFYFDGVEWLLAQQKTGINQAPLFNVYDSVGVSFGDMLKYPSTTFVGSKLFSYAIGTGVVDSILRFPLKYLSLSNVGDIVFDNNLYTDTFIYVNDSVSAESNISEGFVREYNDRVIYNRELGWQKAITTSLTRQQFQFVYDGSPLRLDVAVSNTYQNIIPAIQLYINSAFIAASAYTVTTTSDTTTIVLSTVYVPGDIIEVAVLSEQVSSVGFYQVPINLENNPLNNNSKIFTLGTARAHYQTIAENLIDLSGSINGPNNTRDLGNIVPYGLKILQQSSPMTLAGYFMRSQDYDIFASIEYNNRQYIKFKSQLLETVVRNEYNNKTTSQILDLVIAELTLGRTNINPFFWSDMLPCGSVFTDTTTIVNPITTDVFDTLQTYEFTTANYLGLSVYVNDALLLRGPEYTVAVDGPRLTIHVSLVVGDVVVIREYTTTTGNFVPNTPSKLGLYPIYKPKQYLDASYVTPTLVIRGHDGSITIAFGDIRDEILLEFEKRIFNNLKNDNNPVPLLPTEVIPGFFRTTNYSETEVTQILGEDFLSWVGWNKVDYKTQNYIANKPFTYNYSDANNKITNTPLLGAWRGIYRDFYDTISPNTTPWEMLGFSLEPTWWQDYYGPAPYTSGNLVLWEDLELGLVRDPAGEYILPAFIRPGLTQVIPSGSEGQLLAPIDSVVGTYDPSAFRKSWVVGDGGPVEAAWWTSSSYPFAVMRLLALTRPAEFFSLFADRNLYKFDTELDQYLYNGRYRLDANGIEVYGNGVSKASYINWIVDYNQQLGRDSTTRLTTDLQNLDVRLCYRMASFTDKQYLKVFVERSSPDSTNSSLLIPDDSYNLLLYKNQPFSELVYSALIVERTEDGYAVSGYSTTRPYFEIFDSRSAGLLQTVTSAGASVRVPAQYSTNVVRVPYGNVFANTTAVVDFILSYGKFLADQGLVFDNVENGYTLNWDQMAQEFLYFAQQGWAAGTMINLNPGATRISAAKPGTIIDTIVSVTPENMILDQNRGVLPTRDLIVERDNNSFAVTSTTNQTISYLQLKFTNFESMVVLDNVSIFSDLIYDPTTASRQSRIRVIAATSLDWDGQLNAQGFVLNQNNVKEWKNNRKYAKGEIVLYKNNYWSAQVIVQPKLVFDYNDWTKSDYTKIQKGLLPNIANKADQLANSYNINIANLESDNDLLSYGLIGFRPRQYMASLNLDDISQVNIYKQFLGSKGTIRSAELFNQADLGKESGDYDIFENWGVLVATYGANANRSYFELRLNESLLQSDPSIIQVIESQEFSRADQTVLLNDVWKESYKLTSTDILPTVFPTITDTALPSAGYVNVDDVDITVFSLNDPSAIAADIDNVGVGTTIWVAKSNSYDWNIYRCAKVPGTITQLADNLDGTSVVQFSAAHNLAYGDLIIIRYFANAVNGVYRVLSVPSITSVIIAFAFVKTDQTVILGNGMAFFLQTMRVSQASSIASLGYVNSLVPGSRAWVDNNGSGHWEVLEKEEPFSFSAELTPEQPLIDSRFGAAIAQAPNYRAALVGSPGYNEGAVFTYARGENNIYARNIELTLNAIDTEGFGNAIDIGNETWVAVGASASRDDTGYVAIEYLVPGANNYLLPQILLAPDQDFGPTRFGEAVVVSQDERWMYISAPSKTETGGIVYAYGRIDIEQQSINFTTDGVTESYSYDDNIVVTETDQLRVTLGNTILNNGIDYAVTLSNSTVELTTAPIAGETLTIARREEIQLDAVNYFNVEQDSTTGAGTGAEFTIARVRGVYSTSITNGGVGYAVSDTLTILGTVVGGTTPANDLVITVTSQSTGTITGFTTAGSGNSSITTFQLDPYLYTATNIYTFAVLVNGVIQRPHIDYEFNNDSSALTQDLTFTSGHIPAAGAVIIVTASTYWQYVNSITVPGLASDALFGASLATGTDGRQIVIGCPNDDSETVDRAGSTYVYDRSVIRYVITDPDELTYIIPGSFTEPVSVLLNDTFLTNTDQFINGQFTVSGFTIVLEPTIELTIGDVLEIETNEFQLVQKITQQMPFDQADFGAAVDMCVNNCSIYIGAPLDSSVLPQAGSVERRVAQSRVYGVITSLIANPVLDNGDTIRINNTEVAVPNAPDQNITGLVAAINAATIPNVIATLTPDVTIIGDGNTKIFDIGTTYSAAESYTTVVYVSTVLQTVNVDYTYNNTTEEISFVFAPAENSVILVVSGRMTVSVKNATAAITFNKLTVLPGVVGTVFEDVGFNTYAWTQKIVSPRPTDYAKFGSSLNVDTSAVNLVVGAPNGDVYEPVTFDQLETIFDDRSTTFFTPVENSGVAFTFDYLPSATLSVTTPGQFVFGQQIYHTGIKTLDEFSTAVSYTSGRLLIGAPGNNVNDETYGEAQVFNNVNNLPSWTVLHEQQPVVDMALINSVFLYNKLTSNVQEYFDYFDPLQGKILGLARRNIDFIGAVDPANYNTGPIHNVGNSWASEFVGRVWWDTDTVRFIDPNQDDIVYASRRWGQPFPDSRIDIYQWIVSQVPPSNYTGPGIPLTTLSYTVTSLVNQANIFETRYYFWVRGITTVDTAAGKTLSPVNVARYIENPRASGIPYIAALNASTVAIYNTIGLISAQDTILHIEYDRELNDDNVHTEYELIADGRPDSFISATLYRKMQDSFCGQNSVGALVPDPSLSPAEQYGVQFRPRQSMFVDRYTALENYLARANNVLARYPISETKKFNLLNSAEPFPTSTSGAWDKRVANLEELSYQNFNNVPTGYLYLVETDSLQNGRWTIYEVTATHTYEALLLNRVQNYDTRRYWTYIDWYIPGYNNTINPMAEVVNYSGLSTLTLKDVPVGSSARVTENGQGKFEIYLRTDMGWDRVGLQNGTIKFKTELWDYAVGRFGFDMEVFDAQYFDQEPVIETRKIIQAINEELFVDDLLIERNRALMLMFNFVYSEFTAPEWLIKTSLIDVDHRIRQLLPYQTYLQDNQDFVLNYIQEVKPYHTVIREFNLAYNGSDAYPGMLTDFDVPAYYNLDLEIPQYVSPILLPYTHSTSVVQSTIADTASDAQAWYSTPTNEWYNNYLLSLQDVVILSGGSGYTVEPQVIVTGTCIEQAEITAIILGGVVTGLTIVSPGLGYSTTATLTFVGGNGSGAVATSIMGNDLVRSIKTIIKYDRYEYATTLVDWEAGVTYDNGTSVRYGNRVWEADSPDSIGVNTPVFEPGDWIEVPASSLTGVDRTMGFYTPTANQPGLSLPLLIDGIEYPGVQVVGPDYTDEEDLEVLVDAMYESEYLDIYLGTRPYDVNVEGGAYIDTYSSHAPDELVPGSEFDTLDMRVYTRPGSDWAMNGHGFPMELRKFVFDSGEPTISFDEILPYPIQIIVTNQTTEVDLFVGINYTVDWVNYTITLTAGATDGDVIVISVYELGGGSQLFKQNYDGGAVGNEIIIPVVTTEIQELVIFVNSVFVNTYTYVAQGRDTKITFDSTYTSADGIAVVAMGVSDYEWSVPQTQLITSDGSLSYPMDNSLEYSNPVNLIVTVNGLRARTAAGIEHYGDGSSAYTLPIRLGFSPALIADTDVLAYLDDIPQVLGVDFTVEPYSPFDDSREVIFTVAPDIGVRVLLAVNTQTQCAIVGDDLVFDPAFGLVPGDGDTVSVTTWNDTRQQNILTQVFVGPVEGQSINVEGFDDIGFSYGDFNNEPGSFDYSEVITVTLNDLTLQRIPTNTDRLWVTLNGRSLFAGSDFTVNDAIINLTSGILEVTDVVMVTMFTESVVPEAMAFRIFQDMRGVQATYRMTPETTTTLTQSLDASDDIVYLTNASALSEPNLVNNIWGILTVDGERIMYRTRNTVLNTVSGLLRGTAGTAVALHEVGAIVYDIGRGNLLQESYQDYIVSNSTLGDGSTELFVAEDITLLSEDSSSISESEVIVYVGGTLQTAGYEVSTFGPVSVLFDVAPVVGAMVTILVRRGVTWYAPGIGEPSDGVALQDTNTIAARFLRGE